MILVLKQSPISAVFQIVRFLLITPKSSLCGDPLYKYQQSEGKVPIFAFNHIRREKCNPLETVSSKRSFSTCQQHLVDTVIIPTLHVGYSRHFFLCSTGIYIPAWWHSVTRQGIQLRTNFSFRDWTFFSEIVGKKDSCLPSEARLDSPSDRRSRKKKSNQGNKSLSKIVFPCRVNTHVTNRDTFFCLNGVCPTISLYPQSTLDVYFF